MIEIVHGIYDIRDAIQHNRVGYWNIETKVYISICDKFEQLLASKGVKFFDKYGIDFIQFTLGIDKRNQIEVISICHPIFDDYDEWLGEDIVVGRIERMRGDLKKVIYEKEDFEKLVPVWKNRKTGEEGLKIVNQRRVKLDEDGNPVIKREIFHKPYDLEKRYSTEHSDGTITYGELMYPYIYLE